MSKTAILGLNKALAPQLASMNIRVNTLAPGLIKTKMSTGVRPSLITRTSLGMSGMV